MDNFDKLYNKALRFLSFRPRSEKEVREYLIKKISKFPSASLGADKLQISNENRNIKLKEEIIEGVIDKLKEQRFINDEEFAKWWVEQRTIIRPRAWRIIKFELKQKGILDDIVQGLGFSVQNDKETAEKLAEKRLIRYKNLPKAEIYPKLGRYLASKGFNWDTTKEVIDRLLSK